MGRRGYHPKVNWAAVKIKMAPFCPISMLPKAAANAGEARRRWFADERYRRPPGSFGAAGDQALDNPRVPAGFRRNSEAGNRKSLNRDR
jgi:hypothetical protein